MSINLATYGLISALAIGGAVHQYSQPGDQPQQDQSAQQSIDPEASEPVSEPDSSATSAVASPIDCTTLMTHHQEMTAELDRMDAELDTLVSQMKSTTSDSAKLTATMAVVEKLASQRRQTRERMTKVGHDTIQFLMANKSADLKTACPAMTDTTEQGGPDDLELGNQR